MSVNSGRTFFLSQPWKLGTLTLFSTCLREEFSRSLRNTLVTTCRNWKFFEFRLASSYDFSSLEGGINDGF